MKPLVSVVMPSLNQAPFIGEAIDSVLGQDYAALELIVADGGSTDGTLDLLTARSREDRRLRWFSGKDAGPASALNLALSRVRGTLVGWLNADDLYTAGAISRAVRALDANRSWLMVYGEGLHVDVAGKTIERYPTLRPETPLGRFADGCFICQPTVFFRRTLMLLIGELDEELKTAFDFDYWLRAFRAFPHRIGFVDAVQAHSRLHGEGITQRLRQAVELEGMMVLARHLGHASATWVPAYLDDLLDQAPTGARPDLRAFMLDHLAQAARWLTPADVTRLKDQIANDARLK